MLGCTFPKASGLLLLLSLLLASVTFAQSPPADPPAAVPRTANVPPSERAICASTYAAEKLWFWQRRLKLEDWNITVVVARATELKPKTLGNIHWDSAKKTAVLHVLDPADYDLPPREMLDDMEFTVVHELIHLELSPVLSQFPRDEANRRDEEHAVNQMADALLKLQRGK
ncbi:MAG: hypothetical protein JWP63_6127 [Candidatus Solibacter sp.]|jgi:hypothetical protein|nr:hypothetical protein [Candidatus Solibacter sp.]